MIDAEDKTHRLIPFPARLKILLVHRFPVMDGPYLNSAGARWVEANDLHTQFFDAGVGCCWFAQIGDDEPVTGETQADAVTRLARVKGLELRYDAAGALTKPAYWRRLPPRTTE